jgi:CRP/FNR family transcriptional regulator, cyclic AMP receptor protein
MELNNKIQYLSRAPMLAVLSTTEMEHLAEIAQFKRIARFQFIYMPDEPADFLYLLVKGRVKMGTFSEDGREVIKEILQPEQPFGDLVLGGETKRSDFAQAMHDEVTYLMIRFSEFLDMMMRNQTLMMSCLQHMHKRLQRVEDRLASLVLKDARERIIEFLVYSANREGRQVGYETLVKHQLTQQEIANLTGTSRQTVTSVLNDLRKSNLIHFTRSSILIRDLKRLA